MRRDWLDDWASEAGLLVLRVGSGGMTVLLLAWARLPNGTVAGVTGHPVVGAAVALLCAFTIVGAKTTPAALVLALVMTAACALGLYDGQQLREEPARALMLAILYAALACTGAGRWSLDHLIDRERGADHVTASPVTFE